MDSKAKKDARDRWNARNPTSTVRLPIDTDEGLRQAAKDMNLGYHGLLKQILTEWLENK